MAVITMASSKGGVGKTTSALLLALELARTGARVALIDADRNQPLSRWAQLAGKPANIDVVSDTAVETITDTIERCAAEYNFVIVDLEGSANAMILFAVSRSDLVIVPMRQSVVDAHQATRTLEEVARIARSARQDVRAVLLVTMATPWLRSTEAKAVGDDLVAAGYRFLPVSIHERVAYRALFSYGGDLTALPDQGVGNLVNAQGNAALFAASVIGELEPIRTAARAVA